MKATKDALNDAKEKVDEDKRTEEFTEEQIRIHSEKLEKLRKQKEAFASKLKEISEKITVEELSKENSKKSSKTTNKRKTSYSSESSSEEEKDSASKGGKK